ncbi:phage tail assembly chaperone [Rubellimicrobium mesophilum]|uniref:phage tail assembly chaperone n=1 Tax=Rubellimicrobium mesophilum TaxID=1123067 RepID=UPI0012E1ACE6|nr:hypothetical protein [Rubellimicrobium mesophilum]
MTALKDHLASPTARVRVPEAGEILWQAFLELDATRHVGDAGPAPITFLEIEAWCRLKGVPFQPHHIETLRAMDAALVAHFLEKAKKAVEALKRQRRPGRPSMNAALFDKMF